MPHLCSITSIKSCCIQTSTAWVGQMNTRQHAALLHYGHEKWPRLCLQYSTPTTILTGSVACSIALPYRRQTETNFRWKVQSLRLSPGSNARSVDHTLRTLNSAQLFYVVVEMGKTKRASMTDGTVDLESLALRRCVTRQGHSFRMHRNFRLCRERQGL